jgi:hypothetical protein
VGIATAVAAACAGLVLAGCGAGVEAERGPEPPARRWQDEDACAVLSDAEISAHLRGQRTRQARNDEFNRPTCVWQGEDRYRVTMMLWQPPYPDIQIDNALGGTVTIAGRTAYIQLGMSYDCLMDVDAGTAWIRFDTHSPGEKGATGPPKVPECDRVAELAELAIKKLGW